MRWPSRSVDKEVGIANGHCNRESGDALSAGPLSPRNPEAAACYGGYGALGNPADTIVECIRDKEIALAVRSHATGRVQTTTDGCAVIAAEVGRTITGHSGDNAARAYFPDTVVEGVSNEEIAVVVDGHCLGDIQASARGRASVTAETHRAVAGHCCDGPGGLELANAVVERVGDEEVVFTVHRQADGEIKACAGSRATVTAEASSANARYCADDGHAGRLHGKECGIEGNEKDKCRGENQTNQ